MHFAEIWAENWFQLTSRLWSAQLCQKLFHILKDGWCSHFWIHFWITFIVEIMVIIIIISTMKLVAMGILTKLVQSTHFTLSHSQQEFSLHIFILWKSRPTAFWPPCILAKRRSIKLNSFSPNHRIIIVIVQNDKGLSAPLPSLHRWPTLTHSVICTFVALTCSLSESRNWIL